MAEKKTPETEAELTEVLRVRREKLAQLVEDGKDPFQITKFDVTHHSAEIKDDFDALEGKEVVVAGRMMSKRVMGKASFCNVQDLKGGIQCYVARDAVAKTAIRILRNLTSATSLVCAARCSRQKPARFPFTLRL